MRKTFHTLVWAVLLSVSPGLSRAGAPEAATTGKVIVLDNENTLEGDIERVGTQYRVRRTVGETWVSGERVLCLCPDVAAAYVYLRGRANLNDADERLRLAEWCRQHGLREQALAEVQEAVKLRPQNIASRRLLDHLRQLQPPSGVAAKTPIEADFLAPRVDLTADAMSLFASRVQPILMNTCAECHASDKGGKFKLLRCYEAQGANRKIIQQNLASVLAQVNLRDPRISPLLTKAVSVHGSLAQAPLKSRQAPAYRTLEDWVRITIASNPAIHESGSPGAESRPATKSEAAFASDSAPATETPATPAATAPAAAAPPKPAAPDPFDPADFNRMVHPDTKPDAPKKP